MIRLAALVALLSVPASAQFPDMASFRAMLRETPAPETPAAAPAQPSVLSAEELTLVERWPRKEFTYDLKAGKAVVGRITSYAGGYELRDAAGTLLAKTADKTSKRGADIRVADGAGALIGSIKLGYAAWAGKKSFEVRDAAGEPVARTGTVYYDEHPIVLSDAKSGWLATFDEKPCLLSHWTIRIKPGSAADRRLLLFVLAYNEAADVSDFPDVEHL